MQVVQLVTPIVERRSKAQVQVTRVDIVLLSPMHETPSRQADLLEEAQCPVITAESPQHSDFHRASRRPFCQAQGRVGGPHEAQRDIRADGLMFGTQHVEDPQQGIDSRGLLRCISHIYWEEQL